MTKAEARKRALDLFGADAAVARGRTRTMISKKTGQPFVTRHAFMVGRWYAMGWLGEGFEWWGHGDSWADAVADAEAQKAAEWPRARGFTTEFQRTS